MKSDGNNISSPVIVLPASFHSKLEFNFTMLQKYYENISYKNSNLGNNEWKLAGSASGSNVVSLKNLHYNEIQIFVTNTKSTEGWYDSSLVVSKPILLKQKLILLPSYYAQSGDHNYIVCKYDEQNESVYISHNALGTVEKSTLEIYYK